MKKLLVLLIFIFILSCAKKEVKLPVLAEKGIQELHNHSQVWFFFEIENKDAVAIVNRKNTISTTHWIFNIDKRLPLKAIIPSIIKLQYKHANSMHSEKGMHDFFSYSDTVSKKLSFIEFDGVIFKTDNLLSKNFIEENSSDYINYYNINLVFYQNNIWINDVKMDKSNFKSALLAILANSSEGKQPMMHLNFSQNLLYQDYLFYRTMIHDIDTKKNLVNQNEFIFNENKV